MAALWHQYGISLGKAWEELEKGEGDCGSAPAMRELFEKKTSKPLRGTKKVVLLQSHSEEFAERTTTFMTFKVVSSLNLNEPSLSSGGFVF